MRLKKPLNPALWPDLLKLANQQGGLISRWQAVAAGATRADFIRLIRLGRLRPVPPFQRGIYEAESHKNWFHRELHLMLLANGVSAVVSHRAAGQLYSLWGCGEFPLEAIVPSRKTVRLPLPFVIRRMDLGDHEVTVYKGFRVTTLLRTIRDLATTLDYDMLAVAFEAFRRYRPKELPLLRAELEAQEHPREGTDRLFALLDDAERRKHRPMDSPFEVLVWRRLCLSGLPLPASQVDFKAPNGRTYRLDFAYADLKIAIEVDGFGFHSSRKSKNADDIRMTQLKLAGWKVIHINWERFCNDLAGFFAELRADLAERRAARAA